MRLMFGSGRAKNKLNKSAIKCIILLTIHKNLLFSNHRNKETQARKAYKMITQTQIEKLTRKIAYQIDVTSLTNTAVLVMQSATAVSTDDDNADALYRYAMKHIVPGLTYS